MRLLLLNAILTITLNGCASSVTLTKDEEMIKIVNPDQLNKISTCKRIKKIKGETTNSFSSLFQKDDLNDDKTVSELIKQLKKQAYNAKGNVVVTKQKVTRPSGLSSKSGKEMKGVTYKCPKKIIKSIHSAEDF